MRQQWGLRATALAATATALVGCSVGGDDADASETGESSAVPAPQKLLALDEFAALNALTLGVKPDTVFATLQSQAAKEILQSEGIEVVDKPTFFQSPDVEQIAAVHPDRILLSDVGSLTSITVQANEIAPDDGARLCGAVARSSEYRGDGTGSRVRSSRNRVEARDQICRSIRNGRGATADAVSAGGILRRHLHRHPTVADVLDHRGSRFRAPASRTRREDRPPTQVLPRLRCQARRSDSTRRTRWS